MVVRLFACALLPALLLSAPAKKQTVGSGRGENEDMILSVTLHTAPADVKELIGDDLGGHYIVAEVKVEPKYGKTLTIDHDDFVLRTDENGEKVTPFAASQIAGREALIVTQEGVKEKKTGLTIGGMGGGMGTGGNDPGTTKVKVQNPATQKENPLEKTLHDKMLVEQKTDKPVGGLLYYPMEKQKLKDLELRYGPQESRITLRFK
jgi:phage pi2 protein 07